MTSKTEYAIENVNGEILCRNPGTIDGQSVNINNCKVSQVHEITIFHGVCSAKLYLVIALGISI